MSIGENTIALRKEIPEQLTLVAVSKTKSNEEIMEAYQGGQRVFGENKIQEMSAKYEALPKDIQWHMIGHVQSNKVKYMAPFVDLIHGVDRSKLLREIDKQALKNNRIIDCLLQIHIAQESTKFGFSESEVTEALDLAGTLNNVRVVGLMGMATFTENTQQITEEFKGLKRLFEQLKPQQPQFSVLSMGMSGDYPLAIPQGSHMIRVGSKLFALRNY